MTNLKPSHISYICDSKIDRSDTSDSQYVPCEHSDQEECDHVSTSEPDSDGDNVTASDDSDADSKTVGGYEAKMDKYGINYPLL